MASTPTPPSAAAATTSRVSLETIQRAVDALLKWRDSQSKTHKPQLLPQDDFIYVFLTLKKIPSKARTNPFKIPLPHPLHLPSSSSDLCLIIDDRPTSKLTSHIAKKKIKSEDIPISKVLKLSKLKSDYKPFEAKRKLCDSYDVFLADKRVVPLLPKMLGKQFFKKKKVPMTVDLTHKNWKEQIERACESALLYLKTGTCSVVRVGKVSMQSGEIVDNVVAAIDGIVGVVPKKWAGVRSFHLKFSESLALPVYQALPDMKLRIEGIKGSEEGVKEDGGREVEVKEESKKDEKLGKEKKGLKKGRIHEIRYMDAYVRGDELGIDDDEDERSEGDELGSAEFVGSKRKKENLVKKRANKMGKVDNGGTDDDENENENEKSEDDELGNAEFEGKKKNKAGLVKGQVLSELNGKKRAKKTGKVERGDSWKRKKDDLALKGEEESNGKKWKKKSNLGTKLKDEAPKIKSKKSKKRELVE